MNTSTETTERGKYPTFCPTWENQRHFILLFVQPAKFVDCAFAADADYLVSEDSHFDILRKTPFPQLNLVTLDEFLNTRIVAED